MSNKVKVTLPDGSVEYRSPGSFSSKPQKSKKLRKAKKPTRPRRSDPEIRRALDAHRELSDGMEDAAVRDAR